MRYARFLLYYRLNLSGIVCKFYAHFLALTTPLTFLAAVFIILLFSRYSSPLNVKAVALVKLTIGYGWAVISLILSPSINSASYSIFIILDHFACVISRALYPITVISGSSTSRAN